jgi:hypothetical protein
MMIAGPLRDERLLRSPLRLRLGGPYKLVSLGQRVPNEPRRAPFGSGCLSEANSFGIVSASGAHAEASRRLE